ncbi:COPII coat Sec23p-Sfb3p heterodimer component [Phlyctochytrium bullatum]|nr:COPII coat Sec23p-Sfb3p heterodimer component [Phlyctochytrium bullatum]
MQVNGLPPGPGPAPGVQPGLRPPQGFPQGPGSGPSAQGQQAQTDFAGLPPPPGSQGLARPGAPQGPPSQFRPPQQGPPTGAPNSVEGMTSQFGQMNVASGPPAFRPAQTQRSKRVYVNPTGDASGSPTYAQQPGPAAPGVAPPGSVAANQAPAFGGFQGRPPAPQGMPPMPTAGGQMPLPAPGATAPAPLGAPQPPRPLFGGATGPVAPGQAPSPYGTPPPGQLQQGFGQPGQQPVTGSFGQPGVGPQGPGMAARPPNQFGAVRPPGPAQQQPQRPRIDPNQIPSPLAVQEADQITHAESPYKFVASKEYSLRPARPVSYVFAIDVSWNAIQWGVLQKTVAALKDILFSEKLPKNAKIGIVTFDRTVHFYNLKKDIGGKVFVMQTSLPTFGPGALRMREDARLLGSDKERSLYEPQSDFWKKLAQDYSQAGVCVDLFLFPHAYVDVATVGTNFDMSRDGVKFAEDLKRAALRSFGYEALLRIRCSNGLKAVNYYGNFYMKNSTDIELAGIDSLKSIGVEFRHDGKLDEKLESSVQAALLYTTASGERRIRVLNYSLLNTTSLGNVFRYGEMDTTLNFLAKTYVGQASAMALKTIREQLTDKCVKILTSYRKNIASSTAPGQIRAIVGYIINERPRFMQLQVVRHQLDPYLEVEFANFLIEDQNHDGMTYVRTKRKPSYVISDDDDEDKPERRRSKRTSRGTLVESDSDPDYVSEQEKDKDDDDAEYEEEEIDVRTSSGIKRKAIREIEPKTPARRKLDLFRSANTGSSPTSGGTSPIAGTHARAEDFKKRNEERYAWLVDERDAQMKKPELYEKDADIAHQEFDWKLTDRVNMKMCGVPENSFDTWASQFVAKGYKVARVDQVETLIGKEMRGKAGGSKKKV